MSLRLPAPSPGWTTTADVIVVGSGVAGLTAALQIRATGLSVLLVTKSYVDSGSTRWAQGGIAAALGPGDTPEQHEHDTLVAGAGLCDREAVRALVSEGPEAVRRLIARGAVFDRTSAGEIALTREGGHLRDRILHAGGDATGAEISRALLAAVVKDEGIDLVEHALVLDLLRDGDGHACGVTLHVIGKGTRDGVGRALGRAVVLSTGGLGQVFAQTTNPRVATGDGVALAMRAGAVVADMEFIQFHPTVMWLGEKSRGQQPLISEAVRGEGAFLVDREGTRFMQGIHPLADLAPRDVVAKAIMRRMRETGHPHMWLDGRHLGRAMWTERFPTILASCREHGVDPVSGLIPVAPAAHYASGGLRVDLNGRTSIPGLYAAGEVACTGVHGANRLASNSLLEGLVFAARIADDIAATITQPGPALPEGTVIDAVDPLMRDGIADVMAEGAGVLRSAASLKTTLDRLALLGESTTTSMDVDAWQTSNLHLLATAIATAALMREETRGSHWREDFPDERPEWRKRILLRWDGRWQHDFEPVEADAGEDGGGDALDPTRA
jgi:L-aspartate oxidase